MINPIKLLVSLVAPKKLYISLDVGPLDLIAPGSTTLLSSMTPEQPAAPDYAGLAEQTAAGDLEMAQYATQANRPDMFTPWGSQTWAQDPNDPASWTSTTTLSPEQQALFEQGQATDLLGSQLAHQGLTATGEMFATPYTTGLGEMGDYESKRGGLIDAMMARTTEDVGKQRATKEAQLIAQGIPKNSEAFDTEMQRFERQLTDARQQAELGATQQISQMLGDERATRGQTIQEALLERQTPLNELNALRSGGQVGMPQFSPFAQQQTTAGPDYLGAGMAQGQWDLAGWNADVARNNMILEGLFGLGAAGARGAGGA
jgi:hypothetical protein